MILDPARCEWRKSQASSDNNACVEVAVGEIVGVRDTKAREAGHLALPADAWSAFLRRVKTTAH
jgi:hypothetical protein